MVLVFRPVLLGGCCGSLAGRLGLNLLPPPISALDHPVDELAYLFGVAGLVCGGQFVEPPVELLQVRPAGTGLGFSYGLGLRLIGLAGPLSAGMTCSLGLLAGVDLASWLGSDLGWGAVVRLIEWDHVQRRLDLGQIQSEALQDRRGDVLSSAGAGDVLVVGCQEHVWGVGMTFLALVEAVVRGDIDEGLFIQAELFEFLDDLAEPAVGRDQCIAEISASLYSVEFSPCLCPAWSTSAK